LIKPSVTATDNIGVVLSTVTDAALDEMIELGRLAEAQGFSAVLVNEGRGDALAVTQAIAAATTRVTVGTNIANIYFRHPFLCAATARAIAELSHGRLMLGLGMSHRALLASLGIEMGDARQTLKTYVEFVKQALAGQVTHGFINPPPSRYPVPIYVAGNTVESATVAGAVGDGLMPFLSPLSYLPTLLDAARSARPTAPSTFGVCLSIPTFVSEDEAAARSAARYNLAFFGQLPNYRRQWRRAGYGTAMDAVKEAWKSGQRREAAAQIPDELVEEVCVYGSVDRCRAQLAAFRAAGVDLPVLAVSPVNTDRVSATRHALMALAPR
jgi:alkanesulfonate monooxygenase SsuD/methylene tetrahydromethanopterin reductase-like flavin-dependent oxidoreductase (luciferase family)